MDITLIFMLALAGLAGWLGWKLQSAGKGRDLAEKAREKAERDFAVANERMRLLEGAEERAKHAEAEADQARLALEGERARSNERAKAAEESKVALTTLKTEFEATFKALAADALQGTQKQFMNVAAEMLEQRKIQQDETLKTILDPVKETFAQFKEKVEVIEKARVEDKSTLAEQIRAVSENLVQNREATSKLVNALRANPKTRGNWGEEQLRNVLEMSGLSPYSDFVEQKSIQSDKGGKMQPDVIVRLPGGRLIVIDSKVALNGYLDAVESTDEAQRDLHLDQHAAQMRAHVKNLASKAYWSEAPDAVDFVAMFVPGEHFFTAAIERDRTLFDDAMRNRVLIVTPATLMALAKAVAFGWRQEDASKNAQEVAELGRILFARLSDLADRTLDVGKSISKSVEAYNSLVGTLETRVLPQARRFEGLGAGDPGKAPKQVEDLQAATRALSLERFQSADDTKAPPEKPRLL